MGILTALEGKAGQLQVQDQFVSKAVDLYDREWTGLHAVYAMFFLIFVSILSVTGYIPDHCISIERHWC